MKEKRPWRKIENVEYLSGHSGCNHGAFSVCLYLECGHNKWVKGSKKPKGDRARCNDCPVNESSQPREASIG